MKFREKSISKLYAFALAAVFALTLAGCGGGGGTAAVEEPPPMPDPQMECVDAGGRWNADMTCTTAEELAAAEEAMKLTDAQAAAQAAYNAAKAAVDAAEANRDSDPDSYDAALRALGAAEAANSAAQAATTSGAAEAAQADAEAARDNAVAYAGMVNQAKADDDAVAAAAAAQAAHNKMVETKIKAISSEAGSERRTDGQPFDDNDTADTADNDNYDIKISHKNGSVSIEIDDPEMPLDNDPQFAMSDGKYVRDNGGGVTEIISVMTDIEAPVDTAFGKQYKLTLGDADPERTGAQYTTYLVNLPDDIGKIASSRIPSTPSSNTNLPVNDGQTDKINEGEFEGTFDGASGTYECVNSQCTVGTDSKGKINSIDGVLHFTPDAGETVSVADNDYMHYGFWIKKSTKDGVTTYDQVQTFAGHSMSPTTNLGQVPAGSAKYKGGAHGVYTYNTFNADSSVDARSAGTFTADVALTAYFGTETSVAEDKHNKLEGTVSNFELSGGEPNKWELTLRSSGDANISNSASFDDGVASVKGQEPATWSASFHGDGAGEGGAAAPPPAVVGEFNGNFANGSVAGAYGATYQKD